MTSRFNMNLKKKDPWIYPDLENIIVISDIPNDEKELYYNYSFSISPKKQYHDDPPRLHQFITAFNDDIKPLINTMDYIIHLELSTKNCNFHFHGIASFKTKLTATLFYTNIPQLKELCTFKLQYLPTEDDKKWWNYCIKQNLYLYPYTHLFKHSEALQIQEMTSSKKLLKNKMQYEF